MFNYEQLSQQLKSDESLILAIADVIGVVTSGQSLKPFATPQGQPRSTDLKKIAEVWGDPAAFHPDAEAWIIWRAFRLSDEDFIFWGCDELKRPE